MCLFLIQVTTRQLPQHRVVQSNTRVDHRNSTYPIEVNLDILAQLSLCHFSNKSTTILPKTYTNMLIYLQSSMVVSTVVWDVCQTVVCVHDALVYRTAEAVRDTSQSSVSTSSTCARYNLFPVVVFLTSLAQIGTNSRLTLTTVYSFQACIRKRRRPRFTRAIDNIVNEVQLPTSPEDTSFHHFLHHNAEEIDRIVSEHVKRYGYISCSVDFCSFHFSFLFINQTQIDVFCVYVLQVYTCHSPYIGRV